MASPERRQPQGHPYEDLALKSYWRTGVVDRSAHPTTDYATPKWPITRSDAITTAGSCFAQHIGNRLRARGYNVVDAEPAPALLPSDQHLRFRYGVYSARSGNIYTPRQLLMLIREAFGEIESYPEVWRMGDRFVDPLRPTIDPDGHLTPAAVRAHRAQHLKKVRELFSGTELMVLTLGLTETWEDAGTGHALPVCPGTVAGDFDPGRHVFRNYSFSDIYADLVAVRERLRHYGRAPDLRILLTVSPVPLTATASNAHVMVATAYSKSVLRAAAGQMTAEFGDVDYFPSYEIVSNPWNAMPRYEPNMRSVSSDAVDLVMQTFMAIHDGEALLAPEPASTPESAKLLAEDEAMLVKCDEEILDAFGPK